MRIAGILYCCKFAYARVTKLCAFGSEDEARHVTPDLIALDQHNTGVGGDSRNGGGGGRTRDMSLPILGVAKVRQRRSPSWPVPDLRNRQLE